MPRLEFDNCTLEYQIGDCLELMKDIPDKSIDLVLIDPPYNIGKDTWDNIDDYHNWCVLWLKECQRVLKDNGSFYMFHSEMQTISKLMNHLDKNTEFIFRQFIVWNKRFKGSKNKGFLDGYVEVEGLRNYQQMAEYILFYTKQDETGLTTVMLDTNNFPTMRKYFRDLQEYIGLSIKKINTTLGHRKAEHGFYWKSTQWLPPPEEVYNELIGTFHIDKWSGFKEYEALREEYEALRFAFNNQKTHHSVWEYEIENVKGHITPKPMKLIENIIKHSSNEGGTVLDLFLGTGTTLQACRKTGRNGIGFEINPDYEPIIRKRIMADTKTIWQFGGE